MKPITDLRRRVLQLRQQNNIIVVAVGSPMAQELRSMRDEKLVVLLDRDNVMYQDCWVYLLTKAGSEICKRENIRSVYPLRQ